MRLLQIGGLSLFDKIHGEGDGGFVVSTELSWPSESKRLMGSSNPVIFRSSSFPVADIREIEAEGVLYGNSFDIGIHAVTNYLSSLGGRKGVSLIGFESTQENIRVYSTYAYVLSVNFEVSSAEYDFLQIEFSLMLQSEWSALDPFQWSYQRQDTVSFPYHQTENRVDFSYAGYVPTRFDELRSNYLFVKNDIADRFTNSEYFQNRFASNRFGGLGQGFGIFRNFVYYSEPEFWSANPDVVYLFTTLGTTGTIQIKVRPNNNWIEAEFEEQVSTLNLAELSSQIPGGTLPGDVLVTGNVQPVPGYIIRNGSRIASVSPPWEYGTNFVGELTNAFAEVSFTASGTNPKVAYLINYRRW